MLQPPWTSISKLVIAAQTSNLGVVLESSNDHADRHIDCRSNEVVRDKCPCTLVCRCNA
jgi:hypothetical protein